MTPDELGDAWREGVHLPLLTHINGAWFGAPEAGGTCSSISPQLVAHRGEDPAAVGWHDRRFRHDRQRGHRCGASCFAEKRTVERWKPASR